MLWWTPVADDAARTGSRARGPSAALLICKPDDVVAAGLVRDMAEHLEEDWGVRVLVEPFVREAFPHLRAYDSRDTLASDVDLLVTVGGDGTILYVGLCAVCLDRGRGRGCGCVVVLLWLVRGRCGACDGCLCLHT